ncbi:Vps62-related protein [Desulfonema magnum]|uniref:VPS protein domain-containing protein n=1 Tax=Desulfonema magnum TaxID=45655 RepID=A0A975BHT0_9BACT|nr:Vps62-related protein [Desulfonema magnum]QTA85464.1 VPS protein domain-containing protein [Desulfonema magnum]
MKEIFELIEIIETFLNRPFSILLITGGLISLLIAVLFKLNDIENKIANITAVTIGAILVLTGAVMHFYPVAPLFTETQVTATDKTENSPQETDSEEDTSASVSLDETVTEPVDQVFLHYTLVTEFEFIWNDKESGTKQQVAFYKPLPPVGYKVLGHYVQSHYGEPSARVLAVKAASLFDNEGVLAYPTKYERIWRDVNGNSNLNGAIWRPIPPLGYRCLGDVATTGHLKPDRRDIVCVKDFLVTEGQIGELIWDNRGRDAIYDVRVYSVLPKDTVEGIVLNLFQGYGRKWYREPGTSSLPVLKMGCVAPGQK